MLDRWSGSWWCRWVAAVVVDCLTGTTRMSSVKLLYGSTRWLRRNHLWLWLSCLYPISLWLSLSRDCDKFVSTEGAINNQLGCPSATYMRQQWRRFQIASSVEQSSKANSLALRTPTWPWSWSWSSCRLSSSAWLPSRTCWAHWGRLAIDMGEAHSDPKTTRLSFQIGWRFSVLLLFSCLLFQLLLLLLIAALQWEKERLAEGERGRDAS